MLQYPPWRFVRVEHALRLRNRTLSFSFALVERILAVVPLGLGIHH